MPASNTVRAVNLHLTQETIEQMEALKDSEVRTRSAVVSRFIREAFERKIQRATA